MRVFAQCLVMGSLVAATTIAGPAAQPKDAASVLAAARQALGGEAKLSAVKSLTATGRTRQVRGDNLVPIEFEIFAELPDRYLRKDEVPAQESGPTAIGFNGEELVQDPPPATPPAMPGAPAPNPAALEAARKARVSGVKQDFVRLTLGMFATSFSSYPLTFSYVGEAEAPQGKADVIDAKGPDNFTVRLFISQQSHLPIMVSWAGAAPGRGRGPGAPGAAPGGRGAPPAGAPPAAGRGVPPAGAPPAGSPSAAAPPAAAAPAGAPPAGAPQAGERGAAPAGARPTPPAPVENRLYFADYRDVDGLQFPFRLRRAVGTDTTEETTFDRYRLNPKIDPKRFVTRK